jgi:hypothetical protein
MRIVSRKLSFGQSLNAKKEKNPPRPRPLAPLGNSTLPNDLNLAKRKGVAWSRQSRLLKAHIISCRQGIAARRCSLLTAHCSLLTAHCSSWSQTKPQRQHTAHSTQYYSKKHCPMSFDGPQAQSSKYANKRVSSDIRGLVARWQRGQLRFIARPT